MNRPVSIPPTQGSPTVTVTSTQSISLALPTHTFIPTVTVTSIPIKIVCGKFTPVPGNEWLQYYPLGYKTIAYVRILAFQEGMVDSANRVIELGTLAQKSDFKNTTDGHIVYSPPLDSLQLHYHSYYSLSDASQQMQSLFKTGKLVSTIQIVDLQNNLLSYSISNETVASLVNLADDSIPNPVIDIILSCSTVIDGKTFYFSPSG